MRFIVPVFASVLILIQSSQSLEGQPSTAKGPNDPAAFRKTLQAKIAAGKLDEATAYFKETLKAAKTAPDKRMLREEYLRGMARAAKPVEAYRAFPGGKESFAILAEQLVGSGHSAALKDLIADHGVFFEDDPHLLLYRGQLAFENKKYADADQAWTAAFKTLRDDYLLNQFHHRRVRARFGAGRMLDALNDIPPARDPDRILAERCVEERQEEQFEKLTTAYLQREKYGSLIAVHHRLRIHADADALTLLRMGSTKGWSTWDAYQFLAQNGKAVKAYEAAPDVRTAFQAISQILLFRRNFADLRRVVELHRKAEPADNEILHVEGKMFLETRQLEKAMETLKKASAAEKRNIILSRATRHYVDACYLAGKGLKVYEERGFDSATFADLARHYERDRDAAGLEALLKARPPGKGASETRLWEQQAYVKILSGKADEAMDLFLANRKPATKKAKGGFGNPFGDDSSFLNSQAKRDETQFMMKMAEVGKGLNVYRVAGFPEEGFAQLARHYRYEDDRENLAALVKEHRAKFPNDPNLPMYTGFLELMGGNPQLAEQIFRAELAKFSPADAEAELGDLKASQRQANRNVLRHGLIHAFIRQGKTVEQYRVAGCDPEVFSKFASFCVYERAGAELGALVAAHRQKHPKDKQLDIFEAEASLLQGDFEAALRIFSRTSTYNDSSRLLALFKDSRDEYGDRDRAIICLVRLKRFAEAVRLAEDCEANTPGSNPIPMILAHAAAGDTKKTLRLMEIFFRGDYRLEEWYRNPDLGPTLRSEAMSKVRERFPDPVKK